MKKAVIFAAAILGSMTLAAAPVKTQAASVQTVPVQIQTGTVQTVPVQIQTGTGQAAALQGKTESVQNMSGQAAALQGKAEMIPLKDYFGVYKWDNCVVIQIPCQPGMPDINFPGLPGTKPENPDNHQPGTPDNQPESPNNKPGTPDNEPEKPDNKPGIPESKPEKPDNKPGIPESKPENPDNNRPGAPDSKPSVPESKPETPDNKPDIPETDQPGDSSQSEHPYVLRIVELVNAERAKAGLKPITLQKNITKAAQVRAVEIEKSFSHTRPNGTNFATALKEAGVTYRGSGENIAWGQRTPEEVMKGWMNSPGHRANILNANYTSIGVGYHQNASGTNYWSQLFTY